MPFSWSEWIAAVSEQRHLLQAQYTDRLVGELMEGLRAEGLYDDSLVIVTADHGLSFETGTSPRNVTDSTIDAIAYAPLFVKAPGPGRVDPIDDSNLMSFDLRADDRRHPGPAGPAGRRRGPGRLACRRRPEATRS